MKKGELSSNQRRWNSGLPSTKAPNCTASNRLCRSSKTACETSGSFNFLKSASLVVLERSPPKKALKKSCKMAFPSSEDKWGANRAISTEKGLSGSEGFCLKSDMLKLRRPSKALELTQALAVSG